MCPLYSLSSYRKKRALSYVVKNRFLLNDGILILAYGKDRTPKKESNWHGPEIFLMPCDDARSKTLHASKAVDPGMSNPRTPKISICQRRRSPHSRKLSSGSLRE